ncbi:alkaline phosphatase, partial [Halalkalibacterium ligniniphilum]
HANDPVAAITDTLEFEKAVDEALEFAKEDKETLVVVVGDHETGGMVIGTTPGGYADNISILKNVKASNNVIAEQLVTNALSLSLTGSKEVDGNHYLPVRQAARQFSTSFTYDSKTRKAVLKNNTHSVTLDFGRQEVNNGREVKLFDMFYDAEEKSNYVNVQSFAEMFGKHVAIGTTSNKPEETKAYVANINEIVSPFVGFEITEEDEKMITSVNWNDQYALSNVLGTVVSNHAYISWGTRNHSGVEVPLYAYGEGANEFVGLLDNTDLPRIISYLMGTELFTDEENFMSQLEERRTN